MATNEYEEPAPPSGLAAAQTWLVGAVAKTTDTDSTLRLRTWLLIVVIGLCCLAAPVPINAVGVAATIVLAMSAPARMRSAR